MLTRRLIAIVAVVIALPLAVVTAPIWILACAAADAISRLWRFPTVKLAAFGVVYLAHQWVAVTIWIWLLAKERLTGRALMEDNRAVQCWWVVSQLRWARRLLNVDFDMGDLSDFPDGRFVLASRHASPVDAVVPIALIPGRLGRFTHYVLKDQLLWDPAISIYGNRLANKFVARGSRTEDDLVGIAEMAGAALPNAGLVIFPEGTYATEANRTRVLTSLSRKADGGALGDDMVGYALSLKHLLPPKPAGILTMLAHRPDADVVILGHAGLEGVANLRGLRRLLPLDRPVMVRWWIHRRQDLPTEEAALGEWLRERWVELDHWVSDVLY